MIIDQLARERNAMAESITQRMQDHQHLLRVKMDLGMEVAAYRYQALILTWAVCLTRLVYTDGTTRMPRRTNVSVKDVQYIIQIFATLRLFK